MGLSPVDISTPIDVGCSDVSHREDSAILLDSYPQSRQRSDHASAGELSPVASPLSSSVKPERKRPIELVIRFSDGQEYIIEPDSEVEWRLDINTPMPEQPLGLRSAIDFRQKPVIQTFVLNLSGKIIAATIGHRDVPRRLSSPK